MNICKIDNRTFKLPSTWDELNRKQFLIVVDLFYQGYTDIQLKIYAALQFMSLSMAKQDATIRDQDELFLIHTKKGGHFYADAKQVLMIAKSLDFLTEEEEADDGQKYNVLSSALVINLIPEFKLNNTSYFGPSNRLLNLTFEEYLEAEEHFKAYMQTNEVLCLNKLIATLYRPKQKDNQKSSPDYSGDIRHPYNSNLVEHYTKLVNSLDPKLKIGIFLFYQGCRRFLSINFPNVFKETTTGVAKKGFGALSLIDALSKEDVTKDGAVRTTLMITVMVRLENAAIAFENKNK